MSLLPDLRTTDFSHVGDRHMNRNLKKKIEKYPVITKETMKEKLAKKIAEKTAKNEK